MGNCISINNHCFRYNRIASIDKLNNDELEEILVRLSVNCLHRCKCVSKRWLSLISDPNFVHHYKQVLYLNSMSYHDYFIVYTSSLACFFELKRFNKLSGLASIHNKSGTSLDFRRIMHKIGLCNYNILAFSHGLLFCKKRCWKKLLYVVCNPLTKPWLELPPFYDRENDDINDDGIMCYSLDSLSHQLHFILVIVDRKDSSTQTFFTTNIFSSETFCWTKFSVSCPYGLRWLQLGPLVVCNGMLHWRAGSCIVAYDPVNQPHKCNIIKLPSALAAESSNLTNAIGVSEGHIRINFTWSPPNGEVFKFWELEDYEKGVWCLKSHVKAPTKFDECIFSSSHGEIVYFTKLSYPSKLILFNMKLGSTVEISLSDKCSIRLLPAITTQQFDTLTQWPTPIPQPSQKGSD